MTTNDTDGRGKNRVLEEILETVRTIDENVEQVLDRLEEFGNGSDQTHWYGSDLNGDNHEY